ncbi:N-acetylmuramidase [Pseudanabaena phage Pan1]|nr:N-acetylmuramidase [Pseudanabaena phage Pan1]
MNQMSTFWATEPSDEIWREMALRIGCDEATIRAVFEVEASGAFFDKSGNLVQRFEPHHFPKRHWGKLGFDPKGTAPWRASLKVKTSTRRAMFEAAQKIDVEAALKATSHGAPQIMGFNHRLAGYPSAQAMVDMFEDSADEQIRAFVAFVESSNLDTHLRSQDWLAFAAGYNGDGQAKVYAAKIESAYRRQSKGKPSATVLRIGSKGKAVEQLQRALHHLGYKVTVDATFGQQTHDAVLAFQRDAGLKADGVVGATTQRALEQAGTPRITPPREELTPTVTQQRIDAVLDKAPAVVGTGGVAGVLGVLNENSQTLVVGGLVVAALAFGVLYLIRNRT